MERNMLTWVRNAHPVDKMVFLSGPRQVGKTTLAKMGLDAWKAGGLYFSWDIPADRRRMVRHEDLLAPVRREKRIPMVVFDELHKMHRFKNWLKGWFDAYGDECHTWVTGSGRLDLYQRGGDSLLGRYFPYRLHPFSVAEMAAAGRYKALPAPEACWRSFVEGSQVSNLHDVWNSLWSFGGFPEPFLKQSQSFHRRWLNSRRDRVTQEDIRDLTRIQEIARLEYLVDLLNPGVGSLLSVNSLREDLGVAFETVNSWIEALERTYYLFTIAPFSQRVSRSLSKARKAYFWDWSEVSRPAARFENLVASHLLKACHTWTDFGCGRFALTYLRDKQTREVDFLITASGKPWALCECKLSERAPAPSLISFGAQLGCDRLVQLVESPDVREVHRFGAARVHVASASLFLSCLV